MGASLIVRHSTEAFSIAACECAARRLPDTVVAAEQSEIVIPRRGVFTVTRGRDEYVLTPNTALLVSRGIYRYHHPTLGGDETTVIRMSEALAEETASRVSRARTVGDADTHVLHEALHRESEPLLLDELTYALIDRLFNSRPRIEARARKDRVVRRAETFIAAHFDKRLPLEEIARFAVASPYHLARTFREITGTSMHRYQTLVRLREALRRMSAGATDLSAMAHELGFADHSHLTNAFKRAYGMPPSELRKGAGFFKRLIAAAR